MQDTGTSRKVVGYATGVFDMFHVGHVNLLRRARDRCDYLIVGVTTDELALERKGKRPVVPFLERLEIVQNVRYVDNVVPQSSMDKIAAWRELHYDVVFVGDDWKGTAFWERFEQDLAMLGGRVEYLPYTLKTSSTDLRRKVLDQ